MLPSKEFKTSLTAYNNGREPLFNDVYNERNALGTRRGRALCLTIANHSWGMLKHGRRITPTVVNKWYETLTTAERNEYAWAFKP